MLTETPLKIPFSVIGPCSNDDLSLVAGTCTRMNLSQAASGILSQPASCMYFQHQNRRSRVFEAGYWNAFQKAKT
jgi:hypothetical protein